MSCYKRGVRGVYFVQVGEAGPIKIGWSDRVDTRALDALRRERPRPVLAFAFAPTRKQS